VQSSGNTGEILDTGGRAAVFSIHLKSFPMILMVQRENPGHQPHLPRPANPGRTYHSQQRTHSFSDFVEIRKGEHPFGWPGFCCSEESLSSSPRRSREM
jgi:hypothetical protein